MDRYADWVTVVPAKGELNAVARKLLSMADPKDVLTTGNGTEFLVPPEVADAYHATSAPAAPVVTAPSTTPKRRGRAPKITETEE